MFNKNKFLYLIVTLLMLMSANIYGQVKIVDIKAFKKIKNGHTHVIEFKWDFKGSDKFFAVFKKYWKATKSVDFIKAGELKKNLKRGDSYFSLEHYIEVNEKGDSLVYFYLNYWVLTDNFYSRHVDVSLIDEKPIAQIPLSVDTMVLKNVGKIQNGVYPRFDFDGNGFFTNWYSGILKNNLLELERRLKAGKEIDLSDDFANLAELKKVKKGVLLCPEENLWAKNYWKDKNEYENLIFGNYKFRYKVISNVMLEEKIKAGYDNTYYLLFYHNTTAGKVMAIVNALSGETIYLSHKLSNSFYLQPYEVTALSDKLDKIPD